MKKLIILVIAVTITACATQPQPKQQPVYCKTICVLDGGCTMTCN